jgi:class 3 adenylate cyclase/tetratricopeptide (TPR) repeat protein
VKVVVKPLPPSDQRSSDSRPSDQLIETLLKSLSERLPISPNTSERSLVKLFLDALAGSGFEIRQTGSTRGQAGKHDWQEVGERLKLGPLRLRELLSIWREVSARQSMGPAEFYVEAGDRFLKSGQPLIAYDILRGGLRHWPGHLKLSQKRALALARSGAWRRARAILRELVSDGHCDAETLSLLARTNKDLWESSDGWQERRRYLQESHDLYRQGYQRATDTGSPDDALYAGINAATTALLLGDRDTGQRLAREVERICLRKLEDVSDYWALATLGECALIGGRYEDAARHYSLAVRLAGRNHADIASTKRNASMLLQSLGEHAVDLSAWFPTANVVVFTGHLIDRPGADVRFPPGQIAAVAAEIRRELADVGVGFGFSAAACGSDLLFLEALDEIGGDSHVVLPMPAEHFIESSVAVPGDRDWVADFHRLVGQASQVTVVNEFSRRPQPEHFEYANVVMTGLAVLQSRRLGANVIPIAVWDRRPARGPGGTGTLVEMWRKLGWEPRIINPLPPALGRVDAPPLAMDQGSSRFASTSSTAVEVRAMLFADVVGYSKLDEEEIPLFVREFMGSISDCVARSGVEIETFNTWGDAIYFVFRNVRDAGLTALGITQHVNSIDWTQRGFRSPMTLRTGLHVGPVYRVVDPVTKASTHTGAHVSRAARIEPIAPPGEVYASEAFAAMAAADQVAEFVCDYVGVTPMAKDYGEFATYHVRARNE